MARLALTRKDGESVVVTVLGKQMEVTVVKSSTGRSKLVFDAGKEFHIRRSEIDEHEANG